MPNHYLENDVSISAGIGFEPSCFQGNGLPLHLGKKMVRMTQLMTTVALKGCATTDNLSAVTASWTVTVFVMIVVAVLIYA